MSILAVFRRCVVANDPRVAAANLIAMVLAWNAPFYPLYLVGTAGPAILPGAWLTLLIFPVFLLVPAVSRRWPLAGRILLAVAGLLNTIWCTWLLGEASGTQLFLLPCIFLAAILFRQDERPLLLCAIGLPIIAGLALHHRYPASTFACRAAACDGLVWLNAFSVALLCGFLTLAATRLMAATADSAAKASVCDPVPTRQRTPTTR